MRLIAFLSLFLLVSCGEGPFPSDRLSLVKPDAPKPPPAYEVKYAHVMEFTEGLTAEYKIAAAVPVPGTPVVKLEQLPEGAVFNAGTGTLTWKPDEAFIKNRFPGKTCALFDILIKVTSSMTPDQEIEKVAVIHVQHN